MIPARRARCRWAPAMDRPITPLHASNWSRQRPGPQPNPAKGKLWAGSCHGADRTTPTQLTPAALLRQPSICATIQPGSRIPRTPSVSHSTLPSGWWAKCAAGLPRKGVLSSGQGRAASVCAQRLRLSDTSPRGISGTQSWGARLGQAAPHGVQELTACHATAPAMMLTNRWTRSLPGRQGIWPMQCIAQSHWSCQDDGRIIALNLDHPQKPRDRSVIFPWCQPPRRTLGWETGWLAGR